ncbi:MAG: glycosyltransferase [Thermoplasmataceae archaeon]|jgi:glycosyltransferase involved in cell wall biosynthesis
MEEEDQPVFTDTKKISIIIPAYNEENRIGQTIKDLEANIPFLSEVLVIFDGKDRTPEVAMGSGKKVKVLSYNNRLGHGGAVFEGIKQAKGDIICFIDADGSSPAFEVNRVCSLVNDITPAVFGSRWSVGSKIIQRESLRNIVGGRVYHYMAFAILGVKVKDSFCGLKAFKKDVALELAKRITLTDRTFNIAIAYNLKLMGCEPLEIGIEWSHKQGTQLPVGIKVIAIMFLTLLGLRVAHSTKIKRLKFIIIGIRNKIRFY